MLDQVEVEKDVTEVLPAAEMSNGIATMEGGHIVAFNATELALADLSKRFAGVVFAVAEPEGMKLAKAGARELMKYRTGLEEKRKELKAPILERGRLLDSEAERIKLALVALETPLVAQIDAQEAIEEAARVEAERVAAERVAEIQARIDKIRMCPTLCAGADVGDLRLSLAAMESDAAGEFFEFAEAARIVAESSRTALNAMLASAVAAEARAAEIAEAARVAAAQAAEATKKAAQAAAEAAAEAAKRAEKDAAELAATQRLAEELKKDAAVALARNAELERAAADAAAAQAAEIAELRAALALANAPKVEPVVEVEPEPEPEPEAAAVAPDPAPAPAVEVEPETPGLFDDDANIVDADFVEVARVSPAPSLDASISADGVIAAVCDLLSLDNAYLVNLVNNYYSKV